MTHGRSEDEEVASPRSGRPPPDSATAVAIVVVLSALAVVAGVRLFVHWRHVRVARQAAEIARRHAKAQAALEIERREKRIGSSLEAAPVVHIGDADLLAAFKGEDAADIFITSQAELVSGAGPSDAFRMEEIAGVSVVPARASGVKCARSWKYFDPATAVEGYPDITPRDAAAVAWYKANS